jgi:hypothetical protein
MSHHPTSIRRATTSLIIGFAVMGVGWSADDGGIDHYIQVDLGTKWYDLTFHRDHTDSEISGKFDDSVVVTPTVCLRFGPADSNFWMILTGGLAYGSYIAPELEADLFEFHLGLGASMRITPWAHFDVMASIGRGYTWIEFTDGQPTWDNQATSWGYSGHGEALATFAIDYAGARISAHAGYRISSMTLYDPDDSDTYDYFMLHGFVVGAAVGFTF